MLNYEAKVDQLLINMLNFMPKSWSTVDQLWCYPGFSGESSKRIESNMWINSWSRNWKIREINLLINRWSTCWSACWNFRVNVDHQLINLLNSLAKTSTKIREINLLINRWSTCWILRQMLINSWSTCWSVHINVDQKLINLLNSLAKSWKVTCWTTVDEQVEN